MRKPVPENRAKGIATPLGNHEQSVTGTPEDTKNHKYNQLVTRNMELCIQCISGLPYLLLSMAERGDI